MRIVYLSGSDQLGGAEAVLLDVLAGVGRLRPSWTLHAVVPGRGPLLDRLGALRVEATVMPLPTALARVGESDGAEDTPARRFGRALRMGRAAATLPGCRRRLGRLLHATAADVVHSNGVKAHVLAALTARPASLVWHLHEYVGRRRVSAAALRRYAGQCSMILANSHSVAADARAALMTDALPRVIHNAVDPDVFSAEGPSLDLDRLAGLPQPSGKVVRVGLVGAFGRWKGHEVFLRALAMLPRELPLRGYVVGGALYQTAGSQHSLDDLQTMASDLGLEGRIGFTGFVPSAPAIRALDIVVHASTRPEPFGMVIAEAMSCGRTVITTATGGARELVEPGRTALTSPPGDAGALAATIARAAAAPELRGELGARARSAAVRQFSPGRFAWEIVAAYEDMRRGRAPAGS